MMPRANKILVRGVNWLGDAVMTTPALQRLRAAKPDAHITLLTHEKLADLWQGHPSIDEVITFRSGERAHRIILRLREQRFDTAVVFPNSHRSALEVFLARIPERIGYSRGGRGILLTRVLSPLPESAQMRKRSLAEVQRRVAAGVPRETLSPAAHHVRHYLRLVAELGADKTPVAPLLHISADEVAAVRKRFGLREGVPLFALNTGAEYGPAKRWPFERFVEVAIQLHIATQCDWLIIGGESDRGSAAKIAQELESKSRAARVMNVTGETSLRELCAVLKACDVVLTNDTGPMHVAAAVGTPVVVPFGSTSPELTGPAYADSSPHAVLLGAAPCAPCFLRECPIDFRCMKSISVEQVVAGALRAWKGRGDR